MAALPHLELPDAGDLRRAFEDDDVLTSASAIAFQVLSALVPLALFVLALLGFLRLEEVWTDAAGQIEPRVSPAAFEVIDRTVRDVIEREQPFWLTAGAALTLWRISSAMRAVMGALDRIYGGDGDRPLGTRLRISLGLAIAVTGLFLLAVATIHLGPALVPVEGAVLSVVSVLVRWGLAAALLLGAVALTLRHAPACPQPLGWLSFGSLLAVVAWVVASVLFGLYVGNASYGSFFGAFASIFVLLSYVYVSAIAFLAGVEVDALVRERAVPSSDG